MQINYVEPTILNMHTDTTGDYHDTFLARHPDDKHLCDDKARWWPEWHEYQLDDNNVPVCGARMLFSTKLNQNLKKFVLGSDSVHLTDTKYFIDGPFNFDAHDGVIQPNHHVALTHWGLLFKTTLTVSKSSLRKRKK